MVTQRFRFWIVVALIGALLLSACAKTAVPASRPEHESRATQPVRERIVKETVVVEKVVEKEVTKVAEVQKNVRPNVPYPTASPLPTRALYSTPAPAPTNVPVVPVYGGEELPNDEVFDSMFFEHYGVNPFLDAEEDPLSTFAMDVDTASYSVARRYVNEGYLPPRDAVRVEEFVNYFPSDYPGPREEEGAFAIHLEGAPSPFGGERYYLLRVGIQGRRIHDEDRKDAVLTFVIDVSGSMEREERLGLVKRSLLYLVNELRPTDRVGIVAYGTNAYIVLQPTPATDKLTILNAIDSLHTNGSTYAEAGLREGYRMANRAFRHGAINRIILCSDGVANVGATGADSILQVIGEYAGKDITLSTVGFGMGNYNDVLMEQLADKGNGNYAYVDTIEEARRIFVENLTGTLQVIALDSKIQVEFNPEVISRYRLLGYENRAVADEDFRNDEVDAGEVGAGHSVTALYEIKFVSGAENDDLGRALTVRIRYQDPDSGQVHEVASDFGADEFHARFEHASPSFQWTAAVAEYAEILRGSYWAQDSSLEAVLALARRAGEDMGDDPEVAEFLSLVERASRLTERG